MYKRIIAIMIKEYHHILRDPRTLAIVILMPIMQLIIFGYAMNMEIKNIKTAVYDYSNSPASRAIISAFAASSSFIISYPQGSSDDLNELFFSNAYDAAIIIPQGFSKDILHKREAEIQLIIDASDPNAAIMINNYAAGLVALQQNSAASAPIKIKSNILFNPDLKSAYFFVPGLIALILVMVSALLTSIAIAKEKELGTMEQILVSPITASEIITGKVIPYIALALMDAMLVLVIGKYMFGVPFIGSFILFTAVTLLYVFVALSLGLLISTIAKSQQTAMMFAITVTMLPTMMLSGFIFPLAAMPKVLQMVSLLVPATYYLQIIRGIMLKGNGAAPLLQPILILFIMAVATLILAIKRFKMRLS